jgi:hypothetical protein
MAQRCYLDNAYSPLDESLYAMVIPDGLSILARENPDAAFSGLMLMHLKISPILSLSISPLMVRMAAVSSHCSSEECSGCSTSDANGLFLRISCCCGVSSWPVRSPSLR